MRKNYFQTPEGIRYREVLIALALNKLAASDSQAKIKLQQLHPLITLSTAAMPPSVDSLCYKRESHQHKYIIFYFPEEEENISQHPENGNYMKDTEEKEAQELKSLDVWYNQHYSIPQTSLTKYLKKELLFTTFIPLMFY